MGKLAFEWRLRWAIWKARRGDKRPLNALRKRSVRRASEAAASLTETVKATQEAFCAFTAAQYLTQSRTRLDSSVKPPLD